jgi:hypothetical protein
LRPADAIGFKAGRLARNHEAQVVPDIRFGVVAAMTERDQIGARKFRASLTQPPARVSTAFSAI